MSDTQTIEKRLAEAVEEARNELGRHLGNWGADHQPHHYNPVLDRYGTLRELQGRWKEHPLDGCDDTCMLVIEIERMLEVLP